MPLLSHILRALCLKRSHPEDPRADCPSAWLTDDELAAERAYLEGEQPSPVTGEE